MTAFNGLPLAGTLKWSFATRRVDRSALACLSPDLGSAVAGDLVLCRVVELGQHRKLQLADRRTSEMYPDREKGMRGKADRYARCCGDAVYLDQPSVTTKGIHPDPQQGEDCPTESGGYVHNWTETKTFPNCWAKLLHSVFPCHRGGILQPRIAASQAHPVPHSVASYLIVP